MKSKSVNSKLSQKFSVAASPDSEIIHVIHGLDGWSVKKEGATRSLSVKKDRIGAITVAEKLKPSGLIVVHEPDGTFAEIQATVVRAAEALASSKLGVRSSGLVRGRLVSNPIEAKSVKGVKVLKRR